MTTPEVEEFTSGSGTWTVPKGVKEIVVEVWGGGAAGLGGAVIITSDGGKNFFYKKISGMGGASGAYSKKTISVSEGDTFNYTVGSGGFKGSSKYFWGGAGQASFLLGEDSSFSGNSQNLLASGGGRIGSSDHTVQPEYRKGASGGDINLSGNWGDGSPDIITSSPNLGSDGADAPASGGIGGADFLGNGYGEDATAPGAGGHGGSASTAPAATNTNQFKANPTSGNGANGLVKITYTQKLFTSFLGDVEVDELFLGDTPVDAGFFGNNEVG